MRNRKHQAPTPKKLKINKFAARRPVAKPRGALSLDDRGPPPALWGQGIALRPRGKEEHWGGVGMLARTASCKWFICERK